MLTGQTGARLMPAALPGWRENQEARVQMLAHVDVAHVRADRGEPWSGSLVSAVALTRMAH